MELDETLSKIIEHPKSKEAERLRARRIKMRWDAGTIPSRQELDFVHKVYEQLDVVQVCQHLRQGLCKVQSRRTTLGLGKCEFPNNQPECPDYISLYGGR